MLSKKMALLMLAAVLGMAAEPLLAAAAPPAAKALRAGAGGVPVVVAPGLPEVAPADYLAGIVDAELLSSNEGADAPPPSPVPEPNPYSLLLIGLGILCFTSRRKPSEAFSPNP
jgi:hypothetical protein